MMLLRKRVQDNVYFEMEIVVMVQLLVSAGFGQITRSMFMCIRNSVKQVNY